IRLYGSGSSDTKLRNVSGESTVIFLLRFVLPFTLTNCIGLRTTGMYFQSMARSTNREMRFRARAREDAPILRVPSHASTSPASTLDGRTFAQRGRICNSIKLLFVHWVECLNLGSS